MKSAKSALAPGATSEQIIQIRDRQHRLIEAKAGLRVFAAVIKQEKDGIWIGVADPPRPEAELTQCQYIVANRARTQTSPRFFKPNASITSSIAGCTGLYKHQPCRGSWNFFQSTPPILCYLRTRLCTRRCRHPEFGLTDAQISPVRWCVSRAERLPHSACSEHVSASQRYLVELCLPISEWASDSTDLFEGKNHE